MKLQVEVESGSFEKVIEEGIKSLTPDELKDIIKQVILEAFTKCEDFKNLLTKRDIYGYSHTSEVRLGPLAEAAVKNIDLEKELAPFKEKMVKALMAAYCYNEIGSAVCAPETKICDVALADTSNQNTQEEN